MTDNQHDDAPRTETERVEDDMTATEVTGPEAIARLKELVEDIDIAALTTRDAAGNLVSRPMSTREMDENGDIWFFTLDDTTKITQLKGMGAAAARKARPQVCPVFFDPGPAAPFVPLYQNREGCRR